MKGKGKKTGATSPRWGNFVTISTSSRFWLRHYYNFAVARNFVWKTTSSEKRVTSSEILRNFKFSNFQARKTKNEHESEFGIICLLLGRWNWYFTNRVIRLTKWFSKSNYVHSPKGFRVFITLYECIKATAQLVTTGVRPLSTLPASQEAVLKAISRLDAQAVLRTWNFSTDNSVSSKEI